MNLLYVAPDISIPHTGDFVGGSTHVLKIAESLAKRGTNVFILSRRVTRAQKKYEKIGENIFTRGVYRGLGFPICGKLTSKNVDERPLLYKFIEKIYFSLYRLILIFLMIYLIKK